MYYWVFISWSLSFVSMLSIYGMCVVALAPATNTTNGAMFHPLVMSCWWAVDILSFPIEGQINIVNVDILVAITLYIGIGGGQVVHHQPTTMTISLISVGHAILLTPPFLTLVYQQRPRDFFTNIEECRWKISCYWNCLRSMFIEIGRDKRNLYTVKKMGREKHSPVPRYLFCLVCDDCSFHTSLKCGKVDGSEVARCLSWTPIFDLVYALVKAKEQTS